jgi:hypothetical protein
MSANELNDSLQQLVKSIRMCIENRLYLPSLILIYSGIDMASWLDDNNTNSKVKDLFIQWVEKYIFTSKHFDCTAIDLYSARCGIVHRFNPDSRLSETGNARLVAYSSGEHTNILKDTIKEQNKTNKYVSVHIEDLFEGFVIGLKKFLTEVNQDQNRRSLLEQKAERCFRFPIDASNVSSIRIE